METRETRRTLDLGRPVDPREREVGCALQDAFDQFQDFGVGRGRRSAQSGEC